MECDIDKVIGMTREIVYISFRLWHFNLLLIPLLIRPSVYQPLFSRRLRERIWIIWKGSPFPPAVCRPFDEDLIHHSLSLPSPHPRTTLTPLSWPAVAPLPPLKHSSPNSSLQCQLRWQKRFYRLQQGNFSPSYLIYILRTWEVS